MSASVCGTSPARLGVWRRGSARPSSFSSRPMMSRRLTRSPQPTLKASGEAFNVGCGERVSLLDIIGRLEKLLGRALPRRHTPSRAGDVPHTLADIGKAKRLMDYT